MRHNFAKRMNNLSRYFLYKKLKRKNREEQKNGCCDFECGVWYLGIAHL